MQITTIKSGHNERVFGLDILRAFAIIFVMVSHGDVYSNVLLDTKYYRWMMWDGVGLFFVLSGFLIGNILIKLSLAQEFNFKNLCQFWKRRWLRTLPNYFLILTILIVCYFFSHHQLPPRFLAYYTFTQCFASPHPLFFGEAWSLAVEEWFYLLIPLSLFIVCAFKGDKKNQIAIVIWAVLIIGTLIRIAKTSQKDYFADNTFAVEIMKQVITRIDSIMYGMIGSWFFVFKPKLFFEHKVVLFFIGIVILFVSVIMISYSKDFYSYIYYSSTAIGALFLIPMLIQIKTSQGFLYRSITFISVISYSMYLTNYMIVQRGLLPIITKYLNLDLSTSLFNNAFLLFLFWTFTILFSYILFRFWEQPILKLRNRIE